MTHKDIYTKFMIEYDKALITSSYPSLTKYEVATLLDKAYLALIAQKLTGNNQRGVLFEGDIKAIEDIRPLIKQDRFDYIKEGPASNERVYRIKDDMLYYIQSSLSRLNKVSAIDNKIHNSSNVLLLSHNDANAFKSTSTNLPWMPNPVSYIEGDEIHVLIDPFEDMKNRGSLELTATYIKKPAKFAFTYDEDDSEGGGDIPDEEDTWTITISGDNNVYKSTNTAQYSATVVSNSGITSTATFEIINGSEFAYITSTGKLTVKNTANNNSEVIIKATNTLDSKSFATKTIVVRYFNSPDDVPVDPVNPDDPVIPDDPVNPDDPIVPDTPPKYVDLGLSVYWAETNIGAKNKSDYGDYYAWGEVESKEEFTEEKYTYLVDGTYLDIGTNIVGVGRDIAGDPLYDVATRKYGKAWHMPTEQQMLELTDANKCSHAWEIVNGVGGYRITSKVPGYAGNSIFLPAAGYINGLGRSPLYEGKHGKYRTSTDYMRDPKWAMSLGFTSGGTFSVISDERKDGFSIRPVRTKNPVTEFPVPDAVDLGLPSGIKWAKWNMGAESEYDGGGYYGWGDPTGKMTSTNSSDYAKGYDEPSICGTSLDIATKLWKGNWRLPTVGEVKELLDLSTIEYSKDKNGVSGYNITHNGQTIFIPIGGWKRGDQIEHEGLPIYWTGDLNDALRPQLFVIDSESQYRVTENKYKSIHEHIRPVYDDRQSSSGNSENKYDQYAVDLGLPSGTLWSRVNLGALSLTDPGEFYAWGEINPKTSFKQSEYEHYDADSDSFDDIGNEISGTEYDAVKAKWGGKWRMPDDSDFQELRDCCTWRKSYKNGVNGYVVEGPNENFIFLPFTGYYDANSTEPAYEETKSRYLSGSLYTKPVAGETIPHSYVLAYHIDAESDPKESEPNKFYRYWGAVIRPVRTK